MPKSKGWVLLTSIAAVVGLVLLLAPTGMSETCSASSESGASVCTQSRTSLWSREGWWVLAPLAVPALLCLLPLAWRSPIVARIVAVVLVVLCVLSGFSVGMFFMPVAAAALILAFWSTEDDPVTRRRPTSATT